MRTVLQPIARGLADLEPVRLRVGALPAYPSNAFNYNLTWSTDGVINEYIQPCEAILGFDTSLIKGGVPGHDDPIGQYLL